MTETIFDKKNQNILKTCFGASVIIEGLRHWVRGNGTDLRLSGRQLHVLGKGTVSVAAATASATSSTTWGRARGSTS